MQLTHFIIKWVCTMYSSSIWFFSLDFMFVYSQKKKNVSKISQNEILITAQY